jgi:hypothetical protein
MLTVPGTATIATLILPACLPLRLGSALITLLFNQVEDQRQLRHEALHGRDDAEHSLFHRALLCAKATRLYSQAGTLLALDHPILSRPLTTILDRLYSQAGTLLALDHPILSRPLTTILDLPTTGR